jgi:hypothetical protein
VSNPTRRARTRSQTLHPALLAFGFGCATLALSVPLRAEPSELAPELGYNYDEIETARIAGTSGAVRAFSNSLSALFVNPANLAATRIYHLGAFAQIWPEASRQSYGVAAVDSVVSAAGVAGGLGATWNFQDTDGVNRQWTDLRFALAYPVSNQFFLGLGGRYMWLGEDGNGPLGASLVSSGLPGKKIVRGFAIDAGATLKPSEHFAVSLVGNNLNNPDHGYQPTSVGGGLGVAFGDFSAEADVVADFTTYEETKLRSMVGLEALFVDRVAARGGYRYDDGAKSHALSIGAGYIEKSFELDVSFRRTVVGDVASAIVFGFAYHLEATGLTPSPSDSF